MASSILNFNSNRLITAVNVLDDMLFFTDGHNEPKKINLDVFREANHSTGTTSVYGRTFQERDITVIRPHPMVGITTSVSSLDPGENVIPIEATEAEVVTKSSLVRSSTAVDLFGESFSTGVQVSARGFYYTISSYLPSREEMVTNGIKVSSGDIGTADFSARLSGLTADTRYYFAAFAFNDVGNEILAQQILTFKTEAAEIEKTAPAVKTEGVFKQSPGRYLLKGSITDEGGSPIISQGFYYLITDVLANTPVPLNLHNYSGAVKKTGYYNSTSGEYEYLLTAQGIIYTQYFAENAQGITYGTVEGGIGVTGESTHIKAEVRWLNAEKEYSPSNIKLTGKVTKSFDPVVERGFIISKSASDFLSLQNTNNPLVYKIKDTTLTASNSLDEFVINSSSADDLNLQSGDTLYVMAYADNGVTSYSSVIPIQFIEQSASVAEPLVITLQPTQDYVNNEVVIRTSIDVENNGVPSSVSGNGKFTNCGVIVYKARSSNELANLSDVEKQNFLLQAFNENKADKFIYEITNQVFTNIVEAVNTPGEYSRIFKSSSVVPLDYNSRYYVMAFCANGNAIGKGEVLSLLLKNNQVDPPLITTLKSAIHTDKAVSLFGALYNNTFTSDQADVYDVGFAYAAGTSSFSFSDAVAGGNVVSLRTPGNGVVESGSITDINSFINGSQIFDEKLWEIKLPYNQISTSTGWSFQAFIQMEVGGVRTPATTENGYAVGQDGILTWQNAVPPSVDKVPTLKVGGTPAVTTANLSCTIVDTGNDTAALKLKNKKLYYRKTSDVVGATENLKIVDIYNNGTAVDPDFNADIGNGIVATTDLTKFSKKITGLDPRTEYSVIATADNDTTAVDNPNLGAGRGVSRLNTFTTKETPLTSDWIELIETNPPGVSDIWVKYQLKGEGDLSHTGNVVVYYIKEEDFSGTTADELIADPDALSISIPSDRSLVKGNERISGLSAGTFYKATAVVNYNAYGLKKSALLSWKTTGSSNNASVASIKCSKLDFTYDAEGNSIDRTIYESVEGVEEGRAVVHLSPVGATLRRRFGSGNWYNGHISFSYTKENGLHQVWFTVAKATQYDSEQVWTMSLYNSLDPSKQVYLTITQLPGQPPSGGGGGAGGGDKLNDGLDGYDGVGDSNFELGGSNGLTSDGFPSHNIRL